MNEINASDAAERFFWYVRKNYRTQAEAAKHYKVSISLISAVTKGRRRPNKSMLDDMGLVQIEGYIEKRCT